MRQGELRVRCPTCGEMVVRLPRFKAPFFPFCSERCKLLDLGKWLDGTHRIEEPLGSEQGSASEEDKEQ